MIRVARARCVDELRASARAEEGPGISSWDRSAGPAAERGSTPSTNLRRRARTAPRADEVLTGYSDAGSPSRRTGSLGSGARWTGWPVRRPRVNGPAASRQRPGGLASTVRRLCVKGSVGCTRSRPRTLRGPRFEIDAGVSCRSSTRLPGQARSAHLPR
jgi:hypothetical protein